ncbi:uncharacterized protein FFE2_00208 [Fusarium fujikuroi]|nr:uncharacterized protein FFE2_00208 [Fusarium fujikuroi]
MGVRVETNTVQDPCNGINSAKCGQADGLKMPVGLQSTGRGHAEYITWMQEMGGFPISEWEIYNQRWLDNGNSDSDDKNRAAGDGGTAIGCDLSVTVGGWISGVVTAHCNYL